jgi:hypothetical protein
VLFGASLLLFVHLGLHENAGVFVYPLDDAYIHLAVSRNLAVHGVWGISPSEFSGASSSPGWTLLLAAVVRIFGVHLLTPFVLNFVFALLLLLLSTVLLARALPHAGIPYLTLALCAVVLISPLPGIALIGMEHVLHTLTILLFCIVAAHIISMPRAAPVPALIVVLLLFSAFASGAIRYESCFAIAVVVVLLITKRVMLAILTTVAAAIGPLSYALYSYSHSHTLLPFSVIMKSSNNIDHHPLNAVVDSSVSPILILLVIVLLLRIAQRTAEPDASRSPFWNFGNSFLAIVLATAVFHAEVGPTGWLMRYEAYLYVLGILALAISLGDKPALIRQGNSQRWITAALLVALTPIFAEILHRVHHGFSDFTVSLHDRYVEHLSQALFVQSRMPHAIVLANDIGFLAFYAPNVTILDPLGLGSIEPVQLVHMHRRMSPDFVGQWAARDHADLAILHTDFPGTTSFIPPHWVLVESWCFPHNLVFQNHVESFYAPSAAGAQVLRADLSAFHDLSPEIIRYHFPKDGQTPPEPTRGETATCPAP